MFRRIMLIPDLT